jgi:hypothetical protein
MNTKKLIQLGAALAFLVTIIIVANVLSNRKPGEKATKFFPTIALSTISTVQMTDATGTVKIRKKGDVWVAVRSKTGQAPATTGLNAIDTSKQAATTTEEEYPADSASVAAALEKLTTMKKDILVSENQSRQAVYEVDSAKGMQVEAFDNTGKSYGAFVIGKNGADWSSHYVRMKGSNKVYAVSGSIRYSFFTEYGRWKDKTITKFDRSKAKQISITKQATIIVLEKPSDTAATWNMTVPEKATAKIADVNTILDGLSRFNCADWEEAALTPDSMGFTNPSMTISVTLTNGEQKLITVGKKKGGTSRFWVRTADTGPVFLVDDTEIQKFDKKPEDLKEPAAATTPAPAAAPAVAAAPKKAEAKKK